MCDIEGGFVAAVAAMELPEKVDIDQVVELLEQAVAALVVKEVDEAVDALDFEDEINEEVSKVDWGNNETLADMVKEAVSEHLGAENDLETMVEKEVEGEIERVVENLKIVDQNDLDEVKREMQYDLEEALGSLNELKGRGFIGRLRWLLTGR